MNEDENLLNKTIDYFSKNYPYSKSQIEKFYGNQFELIEVKHGLNNSYEINQSQNTHQIIKNIDLRVKSEDSKLLIIYFKKPICFVKKDFVQLVQDYTLKIKPPSVSYNRILDNKNKVGTLSIQIVKKNNDKCVNSLVFNVRDLFSPSQSTDLDR